MPIAIAWKCDGRPTARMFMLQCLNRPVRKMEEVLTWFGRLTGGGFGQHDAQYRDGKAMIVRQ
ncbi:hypothetical protein DOTSEDRAFT_68968 [Dothistroma septosporum NZE10]|uniref:Uncharacterized protein n=1 Tax=Dothistroma septosporum (strain NZE10 / CBS 128990) TaxID=675120 RepID=N1Q3A3_DOTSN|nr:hypothetical protein DOTSEDRAFT_68968 [Dothistroma septosporum NZE10]